MSYTAVLLPILAALNIAQQKLSIDQWLATNAEQHIFMDQCYSRKSDLEKLTPQELSSCASTDFDEVNTFLKDRGYSIQLDKSMAQQGDLAVASILDINLKWKHPGTKSELTILAVDQHPFNDNAKYEAYPAVRMKKAFSIRHTINKEIIVAVECENGDTVYMSLADQPREGFGLLEHIKSLSTKDYDDITESFADILFPMINLDQTVDISWLCGLMSGNWTIAQALQQTRFSMNEMGATVQSAVAIHAMYRSISIPKPTFEINAPFFLWIERPGMSMPLFAAYLDKKDWKAPAAQQS